MTKHSTAYPGSTVAKNLPTNAGEMWVRSLGREDPLDKERKWQPTPVPLAWEILQTEELGRWTIVHGMAKSWTCPSVQFSCSGVSDFGSPWTAACQASLFFTISRSLRKLMSIESMTPSNHLILCYPLLLLPSSGSFPMSQLIASGGQSIGLLASVSVLPMNIQD